MHWHTKSTEDVITSLNTSKEGLSGSDAQRLLKEHGKKELNEQGRKSRLSILLSKFKDIMIVILAMGIVFQCRNGVCAP